MTINLPALVHQTTTTVGTGAYSLASAAGNFQNYRSYYATNSRVPCVVTDGVANFEIGTGVLVYGTPDVITSVVVLASSNGGAKVSWGAGTKDIFAWRINGSELTPEEFGARGDGSTDDAAAIGAWFAAIAASGLPGRLISSYKCGSQVVFDLTSVRLTGVKITGNGVGNSGLVFQAGVAAPNLLVYSSSGDCFYSVFRDFSVHGNAAGVLMQIGDVAGTSGLNDFILDGIETKNASTDAAAASYALSQVYNSKIFMVGNCGGTGAGDALLINCPNTAAVAFNKIGGSLGNALNGINIAGGFFYGNNFEAIDIEAVGYCVAGASAHVGTNNFAGGTLVYDVACFNLSFFNGYQYGTLDGTNIAPTAGGPIFAVGSVISMVAHGKDYSVTPAVPSSGTLVRNILPNFMIVTVTAGVDNVLTSATITNPDEPAQNIVLTMPTGTFTLAPGEAVTMTYSGSGGAPSWLWRALL